MKQHLTTPPINRPASLTPSGKRTHCQPLKGISMTQSPASETTPPARVAKYSLSTCLRPLCGTAGELVASWACVPRETARDRVRACATFCSDGVVVVQLTRLQQCIVSCAGLTSSGTSEEVLGSSVFSSWQSVRISSTTSGGDALQVCK